MNRCVEVGKDLLPTWTHFQRIRCLTRALKTNCLQNLSINTLTISLESFPPDRHLKHSQYSLGIELCMEKTSQYSDF